MPHSKLLVSVPDFGFERPRDSGQNEPPSASDTPNENRRHINESGGEHVRNDEPPGAGHGIRTAEHELEPVCQIVQARMLRRNLQRIDVYIQTDSPCDTHLQCCQRQNSRSSADIKNAAGLFKIQGFFESFDA
jgi:hypothetical protein